MAEDTTMGRQVVKIVGDTSDLDAAYDKAIGKMQGFDGKMKSIGSTLRGTGQDMMLKFTAPLVLTGGLMLKTATDFDDSMRRVGAVTGATGDQFETLRSQALELGSTTAYTASQSASAMQYLGMAGLETNEILEATPQMLSLASAGHLDLAAAADISTNVMSGFNLEVSDLAHVSDILARASATSNTDVMQLGTAMAYVGPVASAANISIEETTGAIQILSNAGIQGSMAGTSLRGSLSALLSPSKQATDILTQYGLTAADVDPQVYSLAEITDTLGAANLSTADAMTIFGDRAGPGMITLLTAGGDSLSSYASKLEDCDGAAERMAKEIEDGPGGALRSMRSALEGTTISFGDLIAEGLMPAIDAVKGLAGWLTDLDDGTKRVLVTTGLLTAAAGPALWAAGALAGGVGNLISLYRTYQASAFAATVATKGFTAALAANPIGLAIIGVTTLGALLLPLIASTKDATDATGDYNAAVEDSIDVTALSNDELEEKIRNLKESIRTLEDGAATIRSQYTPMLRAQAAATQEATRQTGMQRMMQGTLTSEFRRTTSAADENTSALGRMTVAERLTTASTLEATAAQQQQELQLYETTLQYRDLADGAETAYKDASRAANDHRETVSKLQKEYDDLKTTIEDALGIDDEITDQGREVERADIRKIRAKQDLEDLDKDIKDKEAEMRATDYGSIGAREEAEREFADLKLRHREATLNLADAEDAYSDALDDQAAAQEKKTELEKQLNGESIESAQGRLDEMSKKITEETEKLEGAMKAREKAQTAHETLLNDINNEALSTKSENHAAYVKFLNDNPGIARTYHVEYDSEGNMIGAPPSPPKLNIQTPKYQDLSYADALGDAIKEGTYNWSHNAGGEHDRALAEPQAAAPAGGGDVVIENLTVNSPKADPATMAYEARRTLRGLGSRGALL